MIDPIELEFDSPSDRYRPRVINGGALPLEVERFAATMAMLEHYVESLIVADGPPTMDPWIDDGDIDVRLACL